MISREDAEELFLKSGSNKLAVKMIYDSIGSCGECKYFEGMSVSLTNCGRIDAWVREDFFCADFKRKD